MISITNTINYCISYFNYTITIFSIRYISIILQLQLLQLCQTSDPAQACRELYGATAAAAEEYVRKGQTNRVLTFEQKKTLPRATESDDGDYAFRRLVLRC